MEDEILTPAPSSSPSWAPWTKVPPGSGDPTSKVNRAFSLDTLRKCQVSRGAMHSRIYSASLGRLPVPLLENLSPPHVWGHK